MLKDLYSYCGSDASGKRKLLDNEGAALLNTLSLYVLVFCKKEAPLNDNKLSKTDTKSWSLPIT